MLTFWLLYTYCLLERLGELVISRRNQSRLLKLGFAEQESTMGLRIMIATHVGWYLCMALEAFICPTASLVEYSLPLMLVFVAAQGLRFWALFTLGKRWNISVIIPEGDNRSFIASGPYRFIRHPNYLVVITEIATLPLLGGAIYTAIIFSILNGLVLMRRIPLEEAHLFSIPGYREKMASKGRFIPSLRVNNAKA